MRIVGLTGGIASGKSSVGKLVRARTPHSPAYIDLDLLAKELLDASTRDGRANLERVTRAFGETMLKPDGSLDRDALAALIYADRTKRRTLDALMRRPLAFALLRDLARAYAAGADTCVVDAPLLFEAGMRPLCATLVVVWCGRQQQLERLCARDGVSLTDAQSRIAAQWSLDEKAARADVVIDNSGTPAQLASQVDRVWSELERQSPDIQRIPWFLRPVTASSLLLGILLWVVLVSRTLCAHLVSSRLFRSRAGSETRSLSKSYVVQ